ncbi:MAG: YbjN domain-containing protein, partial [Armatimonadia bacterium]
QVTQKEGDMEKAIGKYMKDAHGLDFQAVPDEDGKGGLTLVMAMDSDKVPDFSSFIKSLPYQQDDKGTITQRAIVIGFVSGMKVPNEKRAAILERMNTLNDGQDFTHLYIDKDNEIGFRWMFVVTPDGLPAGYIFNAMAYMMPAWEAAQPQLAKVLQ